MIDQAKNPLPLKIGQISKKSGSKKDVVKGIVIGGVATFAVSAMFLKPAPTNASASVLIPSLATIGNQIMEYLSVMTDWIDQWLPSLDGLIDATGLLEGWNKSEQAQTAMRKAIEESAVYHVQGGGEYMTAMNETLALIRNSEGEIDPVKAAEVMTPPAPLTKYQVSTDEVERVWNHATLITGDEPLKPVSSTRQDSLRGVEYEYKRIQTLQTRLLAQDAIQNYPLSGPRVQGYREHLAQVSSNDSISTMTPGQIAASQLEVSANVEIPAAIDQLESSLRQERILGAMLAQQIQGDVNDLLQSDQAR